MFRPLPITLEELNMKKKEILDSGREYPMTIDEYKSLNWRHGCACHLNPPCSYCVDMPCEEEDALARTWEEEEDNPAAVNASPSDIWDAVLASCGKK